jgi:phosphomannomutase
VSVTLDDALFARARAWAAADPDPDTRAELEALIQASAVEELSERFQAELDFGTAGLRGEVAAGPARMNRAVVVRAVRALAEHLLAQVPDARALPVVVGYDARPTSRALAEAAAGVLLGAGLSVRWFEQAVPTPLVAYAARVFSASAAIVVTASHNPKQDNGLKVYGHDALQLLAPADADVARRRAEVGPAASISHVDFPRVRSGVLGARVELLSSALEDRYLDELEASLPARQNGPSLSVVYTPLHGVGLRLAQAALARRGFTNFHAVPEQAQPDGAFPTCAFPNPEVSGTLDLALALAKRVHADLVVANDPDADRLAAAVATGNGEYRQLSGNEVGLLLADFVLQLAPTKPTPLLVTSIVSSPALSRIAAAHGARAERTLTGFKWIWTAARALERSSHVRFAFGCEEALGYSIGQLVRDKDGISAAVWLCELAERCRRRGETLLDRLHALYATHGYWGSAQHSLVKPGASGIVAIRECVERLAQSPPNSLGGLDCREVRDYRVGAEQRAPWLGQSPLLELTLSDDCRVLVRPSGTEPKLKIYADARVTPAPGESPAVVSARAEQRSRQLAEALAIWLEAP